MRTHHETTWEIKQEGYNLFSCPYSFSFSSPHSSLSLLLLLKQFVSTSLTFIYFQPHGCLPILPFPRGHTAQRLPSLDPPWCPHPYPPPPHPPSGLPSNTADTPPTSPSGFLLGLCIAFSCLTPVAIPPLPRIRWIFPCLPLLVGKIKILRVP